MPFIPHHVTASPSSPGDNHKSTGGRSERIQGQAKMAVKLIQLHRYQGSPLFPIFCSLTRSLHRHASVAQGHGPSHHPSTLTSVPLVLALHLPLPSTPFWLYGAHPFFPHAQTMSILTDLLHSLTPFLVKDQFWALLYF